jgi:hypothetical protein
MVHGVFLGLRVLFWAIVLLGCFIYCMGVFVRRTIGNVEQGNKYFDDFRSLPWAMFTLFRCFTDGCSAIDGTPLHVHLAKELGLVFVVVYIFVFLFVTVGIFNLIMGIFIDNVFTASRRRSQLSRGENALEMENKLKETLYDMSMRTPGQTRRKSKFEHACRSLRSWFQRLSFSKGHSQTVSRLRATSVDAKMSRLGDDMKISRLVFRMWLNDPHLLDLLDRCEINTSNKAELFDVLDCDQSGELDVREIVSGLMRMRGPPQKSDSVAALLGVRHLVTAVEDLREKLDRAIGTGTGPSTR